MNFILENLLFNKLWLFKCRYIVVSYSYLHSSLTLFVPFGDEHLCIISADNDLWKLHGLMLATLNNLKLLSILTIVNAFLLIDHIKQLLVFWPSEVLFLRLVIDDAAIAIDLWFKFIFIIPVDIFFANRIMLYLVDIFEHCQHLRAQIESEV